MTYDKYTQNNIDDLIHNDPFLAKEAEEKYNIYRRVDPFPNVREALLNSVDMLSYLLTVGIVEPFNVDNIKGVTYACSFSGKAYRYNNGGMEEINLIDDKDEFILKKNSITYLEIYEQLRVPEYIVLRFNLSVSNVYKGILLGTGPIIDPGFEGKLFIPLHNLTGNDYIIKKGASLIRIEFTKLSKNPTWKAKAIHTKVFSTSLKPIIKKTPQNARFSTFIEEALLDYDKKKFYTKNGIVSVRSSIPEVIADSAKQAQNAANVVEKFKNTGILGICGLFLTLIALIFTTYILIHDSNSRYDNLVQQINDYEFIQDQNQQTISDLKKRILEIEITDNNVNFDLLSNEFSTFVDKSQKEDIATKNKIADMEDKISELQKQQQ